MSLERPERLQLPLPVLAISGIRLRLHLKLRTLDKPFGFLVLKLSGVRLTKVSSINYTWSFGGYTKARVGIWIRFVWVIIELGL